jgi:hypothetical protein
MLKLKMTGGREVMACWSNMAPCGMMSERLAEILGLETLPLRNGRKRLWSPIGGSFGGEREQWHFVRELEVSFEAKSLESGNAQMQTLTLGPLLVVPSPVSPLVLGQDLHRAVGGSIGLAQGKWTFEGLGVSAERFPLDFFTGPDPDKPTEPFHGSCSWMWSSETEHETCGKCGFCFPKLMKCKGCKEVFYCSRTCQREDWKNHKRSCRSVDGSCGSSL